MGHIQRYLLRKSENRFSGMSTFWSSILTLARMGLTVNYRYVQGPASVDEPLYTACSVFNREPRLFILCQRKYLLHLSSWRWDRQVHTLPNQAVNIFVRDDDEALIILGDNGSDRRLRTYVLPIPISGSPEPAKVALSNLNQYRAALDSAVLTRTTRGQIVLTVATSRGEFLAVKLPDDT